MKISIFKLFAKRWENRRAPPDQMPSSYRHKEVMASDINSACLQKSKKYRKEYVSTSKGGKSHEEN